MASQIVNFSDCSLCRTLAGHWFVKDGAHHADPEVSTLVTDSARSPVMSATAISATVKSATNQLGENQLGDNLFRLSVCFVLIEQNKLSKKAVLSQGNHAMLHLPHNIS